jgi:fibrillarin-like rRNA methylase
LQGIGSILTTNQELFRYLQFTVEYVANFTTSVCCKILQHAEENNILYPLQHGFRKGRSCETQLIEFVDDISKNLQEGRQTDILIMDFAKAFDKVNHSLLIHKLRWQK